MIDGQHRLYGYAHARSSDDRIKNDNSVIQVLAFDNIKKQKEMNMFVDLNSKQVKIPPQILVELYGDLHWYSDDTKLAFQALISRLIIKLNSDDSSPLYDRMITSTNKKNLCRTIGLQSMNTGLRSSGLIGSIKGNNITPGPFSTSNTLDYEDNLDRSYEILREILLVLKSDLKTQWDPSSADDFTYFCGNVGIRALLLTLSDIALHIQRRDETRLCDLHIDEIIKKFYPFVNSITNYFKKTDPKELKAKWSKSGSSAALIVKHSRELGLIVNKSHLEFKPAWFDDYLQKEQDTLRNEANDFVASIERKLFRIVKGIVLPRDILQRFESYCSGDYVTCKGYKKQEIKTIF